MNQNIRQPRPNVVVVLADQMNASWLGCAGHTQVQTPNLDRFAESGVRFDRAYCQNPICTPSRVSILSGQYCHNHGHYGLAGNANFALPHFLRHFRHHGYRTAAYGKLHLPCAPRNWIANDVDEFGDSYETADGQIGQSSFFAELEEQGLRDFEDSWNNSQHYGATRIPIDAMPSMLPFESTQEMWCCRRAMAFMERCGEQPFCLQIAFQKPHHPLLPQQQFWDSYRDDLDLPEGWDHEPRHRPPHFREQWRQWRRYEAEFANHGESFADFVRRCWRGTLACVTQIDHVFGRLLDFLKQSRLEDNTIVVFGSDHGAYHGLYGQLEKAPGICSDAVCRVPMLWRAPHLAEKHQLCSALVENVDIAPTLCSLAGLPPMTSVDGKDLTPLLRGEAGGVRESAVTENAWSKAIRWGPWRMVHYPMGMFGEEDVGELYDLADDPLEQRNLYHSADHQAIVREGRRRLLDWLIQTARLVTPPDLQRRDSPQREVPLATDGRVINERMPLHRADLLKNYL